jgi:hypothetical protein
MNKFFQIENWYTNPIIKQNTVPTKFIHITKEQANDIINYQYCISFPNISKNLVKLKQTLDQYISKSGSFIRLSTCSPQDAALRLPKTLQILNENLTRFENENLCLIYSLHQALKVENGEEAIILLLNSKRVLNAIEQALLAGENSILLAIRDWVKMLQLLKIRLTKS